MNQERPERYGAENEADGGNDEEPSPRSRSARCYAAVTTFYHLPIRAPSVTEVRAELLETILGVLDANLSEYDPWLYEYCGEFGRPRQLEKWTRHYADLLDFGRVHETGGRSLLDAGCGFGFGILILAQFGFERLVGIDTHPSMVRTVEAYLPLLPDELRNRIQVERSSVADTPYPRESFDVVVSNEAISHYRDIDAFLDETHRVLKRGGVLLVADGNNARNPWTARRIKEVWRAFEFGAEGVVHGHRVETSFIEKRRAILRKALPQQPPDVVERLAHGTFGLDREAVEAAGHKYVDEGVLPESAYREGTPPLDPEFNQVIERLIDPYALGKLLEQHGFDVKVRGYWGGSNGRPLIRAANRVLAAFSPLSIVTARQFRVAAWKR
jgi:SAM-dependent methyltransferase